MTGGWSSALLASRSEGAGPGGWPAHPPQPRAARAQDVVVGRVQPSPRRPSLLAAGRREAGAGKYVACALSLPVSLRCESDLARTSCAGGQVASRRSHAPPGARADRLPFGPSSSSSRQQLSRNAHPVRRARLPLQAPSPSSSPRPTTLSRPSMHPSSAGAQHGPPPGLSLPPPAGGPTSSANLLPSGLSPAVLPSVGSPLEGLKSGVDSLFAQLHAEKLLSVPSPLRCWARRDPGLTRA